MDVSSHTVLLPAGTNVPDWLHLIPAGAFSGLDGAKFVLADPAAVIGASLTAENTKLPVDENHSTQRAPASGSPSPARGWIVELQNRNDGIWGRVEWNESGTALMTDRSYKGVSPVFSYDKKSGAVLAILSAALTNNPNLTQLTALHTNGNHMDKITICTALGIAGTVDDTAVIAAARTAAESAVALQTARAELVTLTAENQKLKSTMVPADTALALQTRVDTLEAAAKRAAAVAFVDGAIKAGKPIAALRDFYIAQHVANATDIETALNALPSIHGNGGERRVVLHDAADGDPDLAEMTAGDMAVCTKMGIDPKQFAATKKKIAATTEGNAV